MLAPIETLLQVWLISSNSAIRTGLAFRFFRGAEARRDTFKLASFDCFYNSNSNNNNNNNNHNNNNNGQQLTGIDTSHHDAISGYLEAYFGLFGYFELC